MLVAMFRCFDVLGWADGTMRFGGGFARCCGRWVDERAERRQQRVGSLRWSHVGRWLARLERERVNDKDKKQVHSTAQAWSLG